MVGYNKSNNAGSMTKALGKMVGLVLSLYVFDQVIDAIIPSIARCTNSWMTALPNSTISVIQCSNATAINALGDYGLFFDSAITFVGNLFPVIGILGAFEIIYMALKRTGLM